MQLVDCYVSSADGGDGEWNMTSVYDVSSLEEIVSQVDETDVERTRSLLLNHRQWSLCSGRY